jgi:tetratricopeptide (TPR) repeat protein
MDRAIRIGNTLTAHDKVMADALAELGNLARQQGDDEQAEACYLQSLEISERLSDQAGIARTSHQMGRLVQQKGDLEEAVDLYRRSLDISERLRDEVGMAASLRALGELAEQRGDFEEAEARYDQAFEVSERVGDQAGMAMASRQLGTVVQQKADFNGAEDLYRTSMEISERMGHRAGVAASLRALGGLAQQQGDYLEAEDCYRQSLEISERIGDQAGMAAAAEQTVQLADTIADEGPRSMVLARLSRQLADADPERARQVLDTLSSETAGVVGYEPDQLLGFESRLVCAHTLGVVQVQHGEETGFPPVITEADILGASVVGCPNVGVGVKPCQSVISVAHGLSGRVRRDGSPALLADGWGLTDGTPPGTVRFEVVEVRPPTPALVFVSHSPDDSWSKNVVQQIRRELRDFPIQIALCNDEPAVSSREATDSLLAACVGGVVLLSPTALQSHWIAYETSILLHRSDANPDFDLVIASETSTINEQIAPTKLFRILGLADRQILTGSWEEVPKRILRRIEDRLMR